MSVMTSQITSLTIVYSSVYSDADQRKHQSSASQAFVRVIRWGPVNSLHKGPATRKNCPFDDVIMVNSAWENLATTGAIWVARLGGSPSQISLYQIILKAYIYISIVIGYSCCAPSLCFIVVVDVLWSPGQQANWPSATAVPIKFWPQCLVYNMQCMQCAPDIVWSLFSK